MVDVTGAILAGGLGTRLRAAVPNRAKVLAEIRGRPFLAYLLDRLARVGVPRVVLCTGYRGDQVRAEFGDSYDGMALVYSQESSPLGTAGALRLALPLSHSDPVLVINGDSFCDVDLSAFYDWHCARRAEATLVLVQMSDTGRYGCVSMNEDGAILGFDEKSVSGNSGWINAGIYLIARSFIQKIPKNRTVSLEKEMFPTWIGRGFYGYPTHGRFLDIGTPEAYKAAKKFFAEERRNNAKNANDPAA